MNTDITLTPAQGAVAQRLDALLSICPVVGLVGAAGLGKSTVLRDQVRRRHGHLLGLRELTEATANVHPHAYADAFAALVNAALAKHDFVAVDDLDFLLNVGSYPSAERGSYTPMVLKQLIDAMDQQTGKGIVLAGRPGERWSRPFLDLMEVRAANASLEPFSFQDYAVIARSILGAESADAIDFRAVYRHASGLQGYQLAMTCRLMRSLNVRGTEEFVKILTSQILSSNVRLEEVERVSFESLPGSEFIAQTLETAIILPLENRALAQKMGLRPKRGVLLYGPPGTGKTVIGRALAHRMKGKFFLMDGSFISEPPGTFFDKLKALVAEAKANAPSVLFIDDADVLFKIEHIQGVVRFLLSLLDGVESEAASEVCIMMTAMDVKQIPDAVLRSGRVEIWLETKLPDEGVRERILRRYLQGESLFAGAEALDFGRIAAATDGFTQADLRRTVGDAKSLYAADLVAQRDAGAAEEYVSRAITQIVDSRGRMADSLSDESLRLKKSRYFNRAAATQSGEQCGY